MWQNTSESNLLFLLIPLLSMLLFIACTDSSPTSSITPTPRLELRMELPQVLNSSLIPVLRVRAILDDEEPIELNVTADNTVTGSIANVPVGEHRLTLIYYAVEGLVETVLATVTKTLSVERNQTTQVVIENSDLNRNYDDDGDGYTNLAEVRIGTNPHDDGDIPSNNSPRFVVGNGIENQATSGHYNIKIRLAESIIENANSTNFQLKSGFMFE